MNLRVKIEVYNEDTEEILDKVDTYLQEGGDIEHQWEMVEMELGSLQRRLDKKLNE